jgi:hypothetical protein
MDFTLCDISFEHGIISILLSVQCISLPMQSESNMCNLVST